MAVAVRSITHARVCCWPPLRLVSISRLRRLAIHEHAFLTAFPGEPANVRKLVTLGVPRVLEQAACRLDGQCQVLAAEAAQVLDLELAGQQAMGRIHLEMPGALAADARITFQKLGVGEVFADQDLCRP